MVGIFFIPFVVLSAILHFVVLGIASILRHNRLARSTWIHLVALDRYANTLIGGSHKETISARMGRLLHTDRCVLCKWTCKFLDLIDKDHCKKAFEDKEGNS